MLQNAVADRLLDGKPGAGEELVASAENGRIKVRLNRTAEKKEEYVLP